MIFRWDVRTRAESQGITNASALATFVGLTYPTATRVWAAEPMEKLEMPTLRALAIAFKATRNPFSLVSVSSK